MAIICNQWGDTGKGKFSDYFSEWADVVARGTGGNNAGHTVVVNGTKRVFHLIPAGIVNDSEGKITILGNGMVIDLSCLISELNDLEKEGMTYSNLMVSEDANVILPFQIKRDLNKNSSQKGKGIGSTGRGIGPCYTDKIARRGVLIRDLFNEELLKRKIEALKSFYPEQEINSEEIVDYLKTFSKKLKPFVKDTVLEIHRFLDEGKKILLEGAQGLLLSIEHGTYPYVTSSDCSLNGTANGVGLSAKDIDLPLGIIKFPFMTRVGGGPFPTEIGEDKSREYCSNEENNLIAELKKFEIPFELINGSPKYDLNDSKIFEMIKSEDELTKSIGLRLISGEYGATTGRPRRIGWTDAIAAKYSVKINGPHFILTKLDCLSNAGDFKINYGYDLDGEPINSFSKNSDLLEKVKPIYKDYGGYGNLSDVEKYDELPESLKKSIIDFEKFTGGKVEIISIGPDRKETIFRN